MVNLDRSRWPFWRIESSKPLSIRPSIDIVTQERRCHFFVLCGKICWVFTTNEECLNDNGVANRQPHGRSS